MRPWSEFSKEEIEAIKNFYSNKKKRLRFANVHDLLKHLEE